MDVTFLALADYANVTREGKLNVLGVFDELNPATPFPYQHPQMYLVGTLSAGPAEFEMEIPVRIVLSDEDGRQLIDINGKVKIGTPKRPGARSTHNQIIGLANLRFEKPGAYQFQLLVGNIEKTALLYVNESRAPAEQAGGSNA